jgi:uncharacterized protein
MKTILCVQSYFLLCLLVLSFNATSASLDPADINVQELICQQERLRLLRHHFGLASQASSLLY